ncbi:hypothetical protein L2E82_05535 [Cichorium intybus]|uniref:Uncharacterized protein n=1 Tax=Cichorium intybus TaxID=13427 RepID=A0ACB9H7K0_CICIN|nr:hypothetical protein L2E82_05535 [Cichorium intybus]
MSNLALSNASHVFNFNIVFDCMSDAFLSAFSSHGKRRNAPYSFVNSLGVPRMAVAGAKPEFFVPRIKDDVKENESEVNESKSKSKVKEMEKEKQDGKLGVDRAPVSYILVTHQMEAGKMVMNYDLTKKSNDELFHRY